jgi:hypothetical protein
MGGDVISDFSPSPPPCISFLFSNISPFSQIPESVYEVVAISIAKYVAFACCGRR